MSKRTGLARRTATVVTSSTTTGDVAALSNDVPELDPSFDIALPRDHPRWARDRFTISSATKSLLDRLTPIAIRVFGFWDHRVHRIALDGATIEIDVSGSYRSIAAPSALENRAR